MSHRSSRSTGAAVYYRADRDFSSPATLVNAELGRLAASDILDIELATALRAEGIDPARTKSLTITADQIVPALADHAIDAAIGSAWVVPWQAHERGLVLKSFNPANYRVEYYGDSLFTMQHYETAEPDTVRRFRDATLKGWEYALRHPDDMISPAGRRQAGRAAGRRYRRVRPLSGGCRAAPCRATRKSRSAIPTPTAGHRSRPE